MDKHFKFLTLPHGASTVANIFIHGYSAGHDLRDRRLLSKQIPATLHEGINIFGFWRSGHILEVDWQTLQSMIGAVQSPVSGLAGLVKDRARHFTRSRQRAVAMGELLLDEIDAYLMERHPYVTTVNLVGHSLGGRVVVSALRRLAREPGSFDLRLGDVLLMAAAVEISPQEASTFDGLIDGTLFNAWSSADDTLRLCLDEACAGRREVRHCQNVQMEKFGHKDYWPNLHRVLSRTGFAGFKGQHYPAGLESGSASPDPVRDDALLHDLFELSPPVMLDEAIKHLATSSWTSLDHPDRLYGFTREFQQVAGHCLANFARRRGLEYAEALEMLVSHFDLGKQLHHCGTILEQEAALVQAFFRNSFPEGHVLCGDVLAVVGGLSPQAYFKAVDALAERLTLASYLKSSAAPESGQELAPSALAGAALASVNWSAQIGDRLGRAFTNLKTAVKPGYSALVPTVAIIFYARVRLGNPGLFN